MTKAKEMFEVNWKADKCLRQIDSSHSFIDIGYIYIGNEMFTSVDVMFTSVGETFMSIGKRMSPLNGHNVSQQEKWKMCQSHENLHTYIGDAKRIGGERIWKMNSSSLPIMHSSPLLPLFTHVLHLCFPSMLFLFGTRILCPVSHAPNCYDCLLGTSPINSYLH
jgi:hypothetical protein